MGGDYSKYAFKADKHYSDVLMQQGKVQLDSDWNEMAAIQSYDKRARTIDTIGHAVVPRVIQDGKSFQITAKTDGSGLLIHPGRMYVDGLMAENHGRQTDDSGSPIPRVFDATLEDEKTAESYPYEKQPYLIDAPGFPTTEPYLVYLDVWQREVTHLKDPDIIETAVGIDTTTRTQTIWQVKAEAITSTSDPECEDTLSEWDSLISPSAGRLTAATLAVTSEPDPCQIPPGGGYRGLENRLYRIELHTGGQDEDSPGPTAYFKWARHNASIATAVTHVDGTELKVVQTKWDEFRCFKKGDWVEITDDKLEFYGQSGEMAKVDKVDDATNTITLTGVLSVDFPAIGIDNATDPLRHTRIRKWDQSGVIRDTGGGTVIDLSSSTDGLIPVPASSTSVVLEDGIIVTFDLETSTGEFKELDHWLFEVRVGDAPGVLLDDVPPKGIHHHYVKLAIVNDTDNNITDTDIEDCRKHWPPEILGQSCCTVTVGDGIQSHGDYLTITEAVNSLPKTGGKVCVLPGEYQEDNIIIDQFDNLTIEGCGSRSKVIFPIPTGGVPGTDPVFHVTDSTNIHIAALEIQASVTGNGVLLEELTAGSLHNIKLYDLHIDAASRSAIEARFGSDIEIQHCHIKMQDVESDWPGIFLVADRTLIRENTITVIPGQGRLTNAANIGLGRGGIQVGGTSDSVRVIDNLIQGGIGNGITLGSLTGMSAVGAAPGEQWVGWVDDPNTGEYEAMGIMYDILIEHNRIFDMGMNGIGVAAFFDSSLSDEMITIDQLEIDGNDIRRCLSGTLPDIPPDMFDQMGYGGIALADVEGLSIHNNTIEDNGPDFLEPICGIFVLHSEGVDISDNRIVNNGTKSFGNTGVVKKGRRAGIELVLAIVPSEPLVIGGVTFPIPWQKGEPAVKVHNNIVVQPYGRALELTALGPVSVSDNQFTSHGLSSGGKTSNEIGSTIMILNLGVSDEFYLQQLLTFSSLGSTSPGAVSDTSALDTNPDLPPLANGNVMFCNNQCRLDILNGENNLVLGSIVIFSLDDIGFHNNQCDCRLDLLTAQDGVLASVMVLGFSVRVSDNRVKEGLFRGILSIFSWGLFMNAVTDNQTTHCLAVRDAVLANNTIKEHNIILVNSILESWCERFSNLSN